MSKNDVIRQLVDALKEVEFSDTSGGEYMPKCPWCEERFKHDKECLLNKAIAAGEAELAKPNPKPVGGFEKSDFGNYATIVWHPGYAAKIGDKLYTTPPEPDKTSKRPSEMTIEEVMVEAERISSASEPIIPEGWRIINQADESGLGRIVINGKFYGVPMELVDYLLSSAPDYKG